MSGAAAVRSTTASGSTVYESQRAVDEYLQMHYATPKDVMPYDFGPVGGLHFPERCADLVVAASESAPTLEPIALDVGCAVGGATFALAQRGFARVDGVDFSQAFVDSANTMKADGSMPYTTLVEGGRVEERVAKAPESERERCAFAQGDACSLETLRDAGTLSSDGYDAVLASNLLCRLPKPRAFLRSCAEWVVRDGGVLVLVTPFSWLEEYTAPEEQIPVAGDATPSTEALEQEMLGLGFELAQPRENVPFLIREHARKFQWGVSESSVWRKKKTAT